MNGRELHSALKTEVVGSTNSHAGVRLLLVRLQNSRTAFFHSLHAVPHEYSTAGLQTTDCLACLGFIRCPCAFAHSECYALRVGDEFNLTAFADAFGTYCAALKQADQHLRACGVGLDQPEGWGFFMGKPSGVSRSHPPRISGDGHSAPQSERLKEAEDDLFKYILSWIEGGADKGWTVHYRPKDGTVSPEVAAAFSFLGGFRRLDECPAVDFEFCYWRFIPFERRGDSPWDSNVDFVHSGFDAHSQHFTPGLRQLSVAHSAVAPHGLHLLSISQSYNVATTQVSEPHSQLTTANRESESTLNQRDVFLCHASEDKSSIVEPMKLALEQARISYWYDRAELKWGDSLTGRVNEGLRSSKFVIVVLTKTFLGKHWPQRELYAALNLEASSREVRVLPLLAGTMLERTEILKEFPLLNDKLHLVWDNDANSVVNALLSRLGR